MKARRGWVDHVIWWQVYPLGFVGAAPELSGAQPEPHQLRRIIGWLDHLVSLGCNGLLLGPIFTSSTHGYDTVDYFRIDPRLGDDADFDALVAACRERGVRLLLDGVFNHAGREFPQAREAFADLSSAAAGWFRMHDNGGMITADYFEGHDTLITFDHSATVVREFVGDVLRHWLDRGIDGWRLDAAYAVPADFWGAVLPPVREQHPEAWFVGEMIHGDYPAYVAASGLDSITQYEVWKAVWSSLHEANLHELEWTLGRHRDLVEHFLPMTFVGNHDTSRVAALIADRRHLPHAVALLAFVPGIPCLYYGDEFGLEAVKEDRVGGDDAVRPEMPSERGLFAGGDDAIEALHRRLIGLRRRESWLTHAEVATSAVTRTHMLVTARPRVGTGPSLTLALNLADEPWPWPAGSELVEGDRGTVDEAVPPHSWAVLRP